MKFCVVKSDITKMTKFMKIPVKCMYCLVVFVLLARPKYVEALDNTTEKFQILDDEYLMKGKFLEIENEKKKSKFLTFNTHDDDISIEMTIGVPFITIPMKNSSSGVAKPIPSVNINAGALAVTFGVTLGAIYITPLVGKILSKKFFTKRSESTNRDDSEEEQSLMDNILKILDDQGIPVQDCVQRAVCTLVKRSVESQHPTSNDKIVDGIANNEWLMSQLEGSMISEAISVGKSLTECSKKYSKCKINHSSLHTLSSFVSNNIFSNNI